MNEYSLSLIWLLKGVVYSYQTDIWANLLQYELELKKYFAPAGLELYIDKSEGYGYLRQVEWEEAAGLPKLVEKRQLNYHVSLLCLMLRKFLLEHDAAGGSVRAVISGQEIVDRIRMYLPTGPDEAAQEDKIYTAVRKVIDEGFLRKLEGDEDSYEIHRIIKGFINADVIDETLATLRAYTDEKKNNV
ncbi:MAG TPA: DUF4194 domain-containing protein [Chitinophagaceae bacterium]|nr:DUF4194 domain-containing protein [Chitinophagaceae bacterium]